jgi:hypothetical protein
MRESSGFAGLTMHGNPSRRLGPTEAWKQHKPQQE